MGPWVKKKPFNRSYTDTLERGGTNKSGRTQESGGYPKRTGARRGKSAKKRGNRARNNAQKGKLFETLRAERSYRRPPKRTRPKRTAERTGKTKKGPAKKCGSQPGPRGFLTQKKGERSQQKGHELGGENSREKILGHPVKAKKKIKEGVGGGRSRRKERGCLYQPRETRPGKKTSNKKRHTMKRAKEAQNEKVEEELRILEEHQSELRGRKRR